MRVRLGKMEQFFQQIPLLIVEDNSPISKVSEAWLTFVRVTVSLGIHNEDNMERGRCFYPFYPLRLVQHDQFSDLFR